MEDSESLMGRKSPPLEQVIVASGSETTKEILLKKKKKHPSKKLKLSISSVKHLETKKNEDYTDFLDSFQRPSEPSFKTQFYTKPVPASSWSQLSQLDEEHFKSGFYPHPWQPFSSPHHHGHSPRHKKLSHKGSRKSKEASAVELDAVVKVQADDVDGLHPHSPLLPSSQLHPTSRQPTPTPLQSQPIPPSQPTLPFSPPPQPLSASSLQSLFPQPSSSQTSLPTSTTSALPTSQSTIPEVLPSPDPLPPPNLLPPPPPHQPSPHQPSPHQPPPHQPSPHKTPDSSEVSSDEPASKPLAFSQGASKKLSRVRFILGADEYETEQTTAPPILYNTNQSALKLHYSRKEKIKMGRRKAGSEVCLEASKYQRAPDGDPDSDLCQSMSNHRFEDTKALRHRMIDKRAFKQTSQGHKLLEIHPSLDIAEDHHEHHEMFVEMDELCLGEDSQAEWREKARWIKYEEDVEEEAGRWGKPHVSSLSFHSLVELKKCIEKGVVDLGMEDVELEGIAGRVVDEMLELEQLQADQAQAVLHALLLRHRHLTSQTPFARMTSNIPSSPTFSQVPSPAAMNPFKLSSSRKNKTCANIHNEIHTDIHNDMHTDIHKDTQTHKHRDSEGHVEWAGDHVTNNAEVKLHSLASSKSLPATTPNTPTTPIIPTTPIKSPHILKRIPQGAEATNVLVGTAPFLHQPISAFVRLKQATCLQNLTEVPTVPVRFLFILLGPDSESVDYREVGRSMSTLMADQSFHDAAYVASSRSDLLYSLNHFLNHSMVLPPGDWHKNTLLPIVNHSQRDYHRLSPSKHLPKKHKETPSYDPLKRQGRCFGGLRKDFKSRLPHYPSDIFDGLNLQCLAATIFVYFACLSPAITFGGLLGEKTDKLIGVSEMLVATALCGTLFSLFSGQPLVIIGATGPVIIFEEALYKICKLHHVEFLSFRCCVGLWVGVISVAVVALEGSVLVRYITRFTEEIFALLISLIFVYEVFKKLYLVFQRHPLLEFYPLPPFPPSTNLTTTPPSANHSFTDTFYSTTPTFLPSTTLSPTNHQSTLFNSSNSSATTPSFSSTTPFLPHPNTAFLTLILTMATFLMAMALKKFRNSKFLGRSARRAIGDFGVPISIIVMTTADHLIPNTFTEKLDVPTGLTPTAPHLRGWWVSPWHPSMSPWYPLLAFVPSILVFILLYMESVITSMIVNKKERCLKKGSGYHLDLFVTGLCAWPCGLLGLPFMCSATVRSLTHVSALSLFSRTHAPGDKPHLVNVKEQRVTSLLVHLLIGASILMGGMLRKVPLAVLFGIFLYMGVASMSGIQLLRRCKLLLKPVKHHPDVGYVKMVRQRKMNLFTLLQLLLLALLWLVKLTRAALAFPFVLILIIPFRLYLLKFLFTEPELRELDREEESDEGEEGEPDFYTQAHMPM